MTFLNSRAFAIFVPALFGLGAGALSVRVFDEYGWSLFLGLPILVSFLSSLFWSYSRTVSFGSAYAISVLSLLALGGMILIFALDGLICLLMALPLALLLALAGAALGRPIGAALHGPATPTAISSVLLILFPSLVAFESSVETLPPVRMVTTSIAIDASPSEVWSAVIAFPPINESPRGIFQYGIAYPIKARIEGHGIGAVRYCTFSTGSFVEPITAWDPPRLLAFDVTENPPPMQEFTLYRDLDAPHLHGHFVSNRGEFRIEATDGGAVLHGTTWYTHALQPQWYWGPISDEIIHRIHNRVLTHLKHTTEES